jgi:ubiquinone/menaquinone biosynthesis C-methylase UbiE
MCNILVLVMGEHNLHAFAKYYDQIYLKRNDYKNESEVVQNIIRRFKRKPSKTLLDVGCGTGEHLKYLSQHFRCTGLDISKEMINTARAKVPSARFVVGDMMDFRLRDRFDVLTCLFSSIGYVQNFRNLVRTLRNFHDHLTNDGLALVESWVFKKDFRRGNVAIDTYEDEKIKLARMGTSKLTESQWLVHFHYLIGINGEIKRTNETHKMIAADYEDYVKGFKLAGYNQIKFLGENEWTRTRGLFAATK